MSKSRPPGPLSFLSDNIIRAADWWNTADEINQQQQQALEEKQDSGSDAIL